MAGLRGWTNEIYCVMSQQWRGHQFNLQLLGTRHSLQEWALNISFLTLLIPSTEISPNFFLLKLGLQSRDGPVADKWLLPDVQKTSC
jgi:hypothetical protein